MCHPSCLTCQTDQFTCVSCSSGYSFVSSSPGPCISNCPVGQYKGTTTCTNCPTGCATCFGSATTSGLGTQCYTCGSSHALAYGSTRCLTTCPGGQVKGVDSNCLLCDVSCATCTTSISNCVTCKSGYVFSGSSPGPCISSCPVGKYMGSSACTSCPGGCLTCFGGGIDSNNCGTQCLVCTGSHYLAYGGTRCLLSCPSGQVAGLDNNCLLCDISCSTCSSSTDSCTLCKSGFVFQTSNPGPCVSSCTAGYYPDSTSSTCTICPTGCAICYGGALSSG